MPWQNGEMHYQFAGSGFKWVVTALDFCAVKGAGGSFRLPHQEGWKFRSARINLSRLGSAF